MLLYDRYDIWRVSPDGTGAKNITAGYGRAHDLRLRYLRTETDIRASVGSTTRSRCCSRPRTSRRSKPDSSAAPSMAASRSNCSWRRKLLTPPVKAKDADVYLLTGQTFNEFPDLLVTDGTFKELRKVSDANPQKAGLLWGTAELVQLQECRRRAADGDALQAGKLRPHEEVSDDGLHLRAAHAEREPLRESARPATPSTSATT